MVRVNGKQSTREYEQLGEMIQELMNYTEETDHHKTHVSKHIYYRFKNLKSDFLSGGICLGTYREFLGSFQSFFGKYPSWDNPAMHSEEILAEIKAHCP